MSSHPTSTDPQQPDGPQPAAPTSADAASVDAASGSASTSTPSPASASASTHSLAPASATTSTTRAGGVTQSAAPAASPMRTVYHAPRRVVRIGIPDGWLRGILAGVCAALLGWALSTVLVLITYVSVADNPWMGSVSWAHAMSAAASLWAMALGGSLTVPLPEDVTLSIRATPIALTALTLLGVRALVRSRRGFSPASYWFAVPSFIGVSAVLIGANHAWSLWPGTMVGATSIAVLGVAWAVAVERRRRELPALLGGIFPPWDGAVMRGILAGTRLTAALIGVAFLALSIVAVAQWDSIAAIGQILAPASGVDAAMLIIAQVLYVPNALIWLLAWGSGAGIQLGGSMWHSIGEAAAAPIPPIPLLGVMPGTAPGYAWLALPAVCSVLVGLVWGLRGTRASLGEDNATAISAVLLEALLLAGLSALSTLSLGSGRLAAMGPDPVTASLAVTGLTGAIVGGVFVLTHPTLVAQFRALAQASASAVGAGPNAAHRGTTTDQAPHAPHDDDSAQDDSAQDDSVRRNSAQGDLGQDDSVRRDSAQGDLGQDDSVRRDSAQGDLGQDASVQCDETVTESKTHADTEQESTQPLPKEPRD